MARITKHSKERIIERTEAANSFSDAKRLAKQAKISGKTIDSYQRYPQFLSYLQKKRAQSNNCSIRVYKGNIYIWKGKCKSLVTVHPIPDRFKNQNPEL